MCGIAGGYCASSAPIPRSLLQRMGEQMRHRGPDGSGLLERGPMGMVHRRLAILDLTDAARQPMSLSDGSASLCYNGELYNFRQLRAELEQQGVRFHSSGDTEVMLRACQRWGVRQALGRFNGMFAFAYWDANAAELWLARDRTGIKPLYYLRDAERLLFASEIKTLLAASRRAPDPDFASLLRILVGGTTWEPYTLFEGLRALQPGHLLHLTAGNPDPQQEAYFSIFDLIRDTRYRELGQGSFVDASERFEQLMRHSVAIHSISDAPVATLASGGIDSSLIALLAHEHHREMPLYHAEVVGDNSEAPFARQVAEHLGCSLYVAPMRQQEYVQELARTTWFHEAPSAYHANDVPFQIVAHRASLDGIKVLLTGEGSDELFIGYGEACKKILRQRVQQMCIAGGPLLRPVRQLLFAAEPGRMIEALGSRGGEGEWTRRAQEAYGFIDDPVERGAMVSNVLHLKAHLNSLLQRNDRMGMMHGLESRIPFLENDLVEFGVNLPLHHKHPSAWWEFLRGHPMRRNKAVVRRAAAGLLPAAIVRRKKLGFPVTPEAYLRVEPDFMAAGFLEEALGMRHDEMCRAFQQGSSEERWNLFASEIFGRLFFKGQSIDQVSRALSPRAHRRAA